MATDARTIKIRASTYKTLKVLAALQGERLMDLVDRLARQEYDLIAENASSERAPMGLGDSEAIKVLGEPTKDDAVPRKIPRREGEKRRSR